MHGLLNIHSVDYNPLLNYFCWHCTSSGYCEVPWVGACVLWHIPIVLWGLPYCWAQDAASPSATYPAPALGSAVSLGPLVYCIREWDSESNLQAYVRFNFVKWKCRMGQLGKEWGTLQGLGSREAGWQPAVETAEPAPGWCLGCSVFGWEPLWKAQPPCKWEWGSEQQPCSSVLHALGSMLPCLRGAPGAQSWEGEDSSFLPCISTVWIFFKTISIYYF